MGKHYGNTGKLFRISIKFSYKTEMQSFIKLRAVLWKYGITEIQKFYKMDPRSLIYKRYYANLTKIS